MGVIFLMAKAIQPLLQNRYVQSWIDKREVQSEKANLTILFERYVPVVLEANRMGRFKKITPIQEVCSYWWSSMHSNVYTLLILHFRSA